MSPQHPPLSATATSWDGYALVFGARLRRRSAGRAPVRHSGVLAAARRHRVRDLLDVWPYARGDGRQPLVVGHDCGQAVGDLGELARRLAAKVAITGEQVWTSRHCRSASTVARSIEIVLSALRVLPPALSSALPPTTTRLSCTVIWPASRSTADHFMPQTCPRRIPVVSSSKKSAANRSARIVEHATERTQ